MTDETTITAVQAAMSTADIIRKHVMKSEGAGSLTGNANVKNEPSVLSQTPGLVEGTVAAGLFFVAMIPVRRIFLGAVGKSWGDLPKIFMTASQLILSADAGLLTCSVVGSRHYLQSLGKVSPTAASPTADHICSDPFVSKLVGHPALPYPTSAVLPADYDPRVWLAHDLKLALEACRNRQKNSFGDQ